MKNKKILIPVLVLVSVVLFATIFVAHAALTNQQALDIMASVIDGEEY